MESFDGLRASHLLFLDQVQKSLLVPIITTTIYFEFKNLMGTCFSFSEVSQHFRKYAL